ncbi:hypothetical protein D3C81_1267550 [compost metagenome]
MQCIGAQQLPFAGQRIDEHFRARRAVGVVIERPALQRLLVPVQLGRGVEAIRPELHAGHVGFARQVAEGQAQLAGHDQVVAEAHGVGLHAGLARGEGGQPLADLARGVLRGLAVQVGAGGGSRRRGVRYLAGIGGRHAHAFQADAQLVRYHHRHLGVQALAHLGAAVVHEHRAVVVHVHQRAGLVEVGHVERDAELHRGDGDALLEHRARRVERARGGAPGLVLA